MKKFIGLFLIAVSSFALNCNALEVCEMSKQYKKWLDLGDERFNYQEPTYCESSINKSSNLGLSKYSLYSSSNPRYSSLELGYLSGIRDQMNTGSCWTFASNSCVETSARKEGLGSYDFSEKHMEYNTARYPYITSSLVNSNGFNRDLDDGGNTFYAASYYYRFTGPILEEKMPFTENNEPIADNSIPTDKPAVLIGNYDIEYYDQGICSDESISSIKDKVVKYGSVAASIFMGTNSLSNSYYTYAKDNYYYYPGNSDTNHAVNIVGWDDSISSSNFKNTPSRNGAWIVRNSWGETFGDKGYFYVSYDDHNICTRISNFNNISKNDYDNAYGANYGLANFRFGSLSANSLFASTKFTKKTNNIEYLDRVSIEVEKNSSYEVYLSKSNTLNKNDDWILLGTGSSRSSGVKTFNFDTQEITTDYTIIVKYTSSEDYYLPVLCKTSSDIYKYAEIKAGVNQYSSNGSSWADLGEYTSGDSDIDGCSSVIFAYTKNKIDDPNDNYDINIESIVGSSDKVYVKSSDYFTANLELTNINDPENVTHRILNSNNVDVTNNFALSNTIASGTVTIRFNSNVVAGKYKYEIKYGNITKESTFTIYNVIESSKYIIKDNTIIINLSSSKQINKTLLNTNINTNGVAYKIMNRNNQEINSTDGIGTNYSLKIGGYTYKFIVIGDVYSDGIISALDYVKIRNHMMNTKITDSNELIAADVNKDSKISALDYVAIKKIIMEV